MTLAAVAFAADLGAAMVRVHDVAATTDFLAHATFWRARPPRRSIQTTSD